MTEHDGLGFESSDAPSENSKSVDDGRVSIGSDERIGKEERFTITALTRYDTGLKNKD